MPVAAVLKCEDDGIDDHDNPAATKCLDCNFYLCEDCTADHKKRRATRNHKIATLAELKEGGAKQLERKHYCSAHEGEELKLYCRTCQEVICRDCTIITHKQHDYTFIKDVREELTKKMESLVDSLGRKEAEYQSLLDSVHQASENETQKLATEEAKVEVFFDKHIEDLQFYISRSKTHKDKILSNLASDSAKYMKQLLADEESIQLSRTRLTNACTFTQQQLSSASNTDLAMMSKQVIQQLETLRQHIFYIVKVPLTEVYLSKDEPLYSRIIPLTSHDVAHAIVYRPTDPALVGKNTFQIHLKEVLEKFKLKPVVTVTLSSGDSCPVNITPSCNNKWSVTYFITCYPQPGESGKGSWVEVSVKINGVQATGSPMMLQLRNKLAVGTKVEQDQQGTVVSDEEYHKYYDSRYQFTSYHDKPEREYPSAGYAFVQWNTGTCSIQRMNINQLTVLLE